MKKDTYYVELVTLTLFTGVLWYACIVTIGGL